MPGPNPPASLSCTDARPAAMSFRDEEDSDGGPPGLVESEDEEDNTPPSVTASVAATPAAAAGSLQLSGITPEMAQRMLGGGPAKGSATKPATKAVTGLGGSTRQSGGSAASVADAPPRPADASDRGRALLSCIAACAAETQ